MASPVYSQNLASVQGFSNGVATPIFVADGIHRTVIKCVTLAVGENVVPGALFVLDGNLAVFGSVALKLSDVPGSRMTVVQWGLWALAEGETVYAQTAGGWTGDIRLDGYLLTLP